MWLCLFIIFIFNFQLSVVAATDECGVPVISRSRIVGGSEASKGEWPWQALLMRVGINNVRFALCGGTLIGDKWILTAAHCTSGLDASNLQVGLGVLDYDVIEDSAKYFAVEKIVIHSGYDDLTLVDDVSMLKLAGVVVYTDYIIPACLPTDIVDVGTLCWITGWGSTQVSTDDLNKLRKATVPVINNTQCSEWYSSFIVTTNNLCAGYAAGGVDACQGDSGGPLVCSNNSIFHLHGVTSWGVGCAGVEQPGVYTRVTGYLGWITQQQDANMEGEEYFTRPMTPCATIVTNDQILRPPINQETQNYQNNAACVWTVRPPETYDVIISFIGRFHVEGAPGVCVDALTITDAAGSSMTSPLCGTTLPDDIIVTSSTTDDIIITFTSDATIAYEGFAINLVFRSNTTTTTTTPATTTTTTPATTTTTTPAAQTTTTTTTTTDTNTITNTQGCGMSTVASPIIDGNTDILRWPWVGMIQRITGGGVFQHICAGTLVQGGWVITAARCVHGLVPSSVRVVLGTNYKFGNGALGVVEVAVMDVFVHQGYNNSLFTNDIGLLKLAGDVVYNDRINPVCLGDGGTVLTRSQTVAWDCWSIGWWGSTADNFLQTVSMKFVSDNECLGIGESQFCATYAAGGVDACQGDSGGPLVCSNNSIFHLHGVTSWGVGCAGVEQPGVYTRVTGYLGWITHVMDAYQDNDPFFTLPTMPCGSDITIDRLLRLPVDKQTALYQNNLSCTWRIHPPSINTEIIFTFVKQFHVEIFSSKCTDYVRLETLQGTALSGKLCGNTPPPPITITGHADVNFVFSSDSSYVYEGFAVDVTFKTSPSCKTGNTASIPIPNLLFISYLLAFLF
ncbi:transmembrane protease serine 9-like [Ciona intestinalis]